MFTYSLCHIHRKQIYVPVYRKQFISNNLHSMPRHVSPIKAGERSNYDSSDGEEEVERFRGRFRA
jgi:hypothetical protein